jgi:hypothetical protein
MRSNRYVPPPEALPLIRQWREARKAGRRPRPYAKELCERLGISDTTLRRVAKEQA